MRGDFILNVIHIAGTRMIDAWIDGISTGNNLGRIIGELNPLQFSPLDQLAVVKLAHLEPCNRT